MLDQCLFVDIKSPSFNDIKLEEISSSAEELIVKARKPYTLTKQREKWTEDEHEKFLEALKLYGRAWRQIQEHISTKTAVQIRSHAQKFFSKVAREPGSGNRIEIPPPRPKRKPLHPYPRKLGHTYSKKFRVLEKRDQSSSPVPSISEQDSVSAVSFFSAVGSETMYSPVSYNPHCSYLQFSTADGSAKLPFSKHKTKCYSDAILGIGYDKSSSPGIASNSLIKQDGASVDSYPDFQNKISLKETPLLERQPTTLKLFGSTFLITSSRTERSSTTGSSQCYSCKDTASPEKITAVHENPSGFLKGRAWNLWQPDQDLAISKFVVASLPVWRTPKCSLSPSFFNEPKESPEQRDD